MTFTYSGNPSTSQKDSIRFLLMDVDETEPLLTDEEILYVASQWTLQTSVYYAASVCAEIVASKFAREVTVNSDSQTISTSELQGKYQQLAERLRLLHHMSMAGGFVDFGGITKNEYNDNTIIPPSFTKGMHDFLEAGWQDTETTYKEPWVS